MTIGMLMYFFSIWLLVAIITSPIWLGDKKKKKIKKKKKSQIIDEHYKYYEY